MAIYHCSIKIIGRGGSRNHGHSAVESAAYRSGTKLENKWSGQTADYSRKKGVVYSEIMLSANAPDSFLDRETLWNSVEMNEKRRDAQLARDIEVSLPKELTLSEHKEIMHDFCRQFVDAGMCVDMNIHDKGDGNPHCHIMLTMRGLDDLEVALKDVKDKSFTLNRSVKGKEARMKELQKLMDMGRQYQQNAPLRKQYNSIKREKKKEAFAEERRAELTLWSAANRYLHAKHIAPDSLPEKLKEWQEELTDLSAAHKEQLEELKECREEVKKLDAVHRQVEKVMTSEQEKQQSKKKDMEL